MDYFQALNYFFSYAQFKNLPAPARLVYLAILYRWNGFRRVTSFSLSDRELSGLTGLGIGRPITQAKRLLKNVGLIDFKSTAHGTTYFFNKNSVAQQNSSSVAPPTHKTTHGVDFPNPKQSSNSKEEDVKKGARGFENLEF